MYDSKTFALIMGLGMEAFAFSGPVIMPTAPYWFHYIVFWTGLALVGVAIVSALNTGFKFRAAGDGLNRSVANIPPLPAPAAPAPPPLVSSSLKYDVTLLHAIGYIVTRDWSNPEPDWMSADMSVVSELNNATQDIEQKACDGDLLVYGRTFIRKTGPLLPIPKEHWIENGIELTGYLGSDPSSLSTSNKGIVQSAEEPFTDMHTSKTVVEELWPGK